MAPIEAVFFWACLLVYAGTTGAYIYAIVFRNIRLLPKLVWPVAGGFLLHTLTIAARYQAQGRLPWTGDYENALGVGWFIVGFTLFVAFRRKDMQAIAVATLPLALVLMGFGAMRSPELGPMAASLRSSWLVIHVYFAWLAFGAFALAMGSGILYLLKSRNADCEDPNPVYERFPDLPRLDELMFRYVLFGFITDTVMIISGAIWARDLWGSYWSWDPVETWSLITWLSYGVAIHLRVTMGWKGTKLAWVVIFAILGMIISFFGVTFVVESSNHIFSVR